MQKKTWIRLGLTTLLAGGAVGSMTVAGCGGDDNTGTPPKEAGADSTNPSEGGPSEAGKTDGGGTDAGEGGVVDAGANAKVYLIHAAADPNAPPLRFCFGLGNPADGGAVTVADQIDAFPDTIVNPAFPIAGLFPGFGGSTASSPKLSAFNLGSLTISLYAINAIKIAGNTADGGLDGGAETPCEGLIGTDAMGTAGTGGGTLTMGTDYWYLGTIPSCATSPSACLAQGQTWIAAVTGCLPGEPAAYQPFCPTGYDPAKGDLGLVAWQLDNTTAVDAGSVGAQFANASSAWDTVVGAAGGAGTAAGFWSITTVEAGVPESGTGDDGGGDAAVDAGSPAPTTVFNFIPIAGPPSTGFGKISSPATVLPSGAIVYSPTTGGFATAIVAADGGTVYYPPPPACDPTAGNCLSPLLYPLPIIDAYSGNPTTGATFAGGKSVALVLLGDPANQLPYIGADGGGTTTPPDPANPVPNGKFAHFLAFPTSNP